MGTNKTDFIHELYLDLIDPKSDCAKENVSYYIAKHFSELSCKVGPESLIGRMLIPDVVYAHHEIKAVIPDFDINDYLDVYDFNSVKTYLVDLLSLGANINLIIKKWPHILDFDGKVRHGANPDLILETEPELNRDEIMKLLELGADPDRIAKEIYLSIEQMFKYGVSPSLIVRRAETDHEQAFVRSHLLELLENGLDSEELVRSELQTVNTRSMCGERFNVLWWYDQQLELLMEHAKNKVSFWSAYFELVEDLIFGANIMDQDTEDAALLRIMKNPVKYGLISLDDAVEYLHGINEEYDEGEDGDPIPNSSSLLDRQYVRLALAG